MIADRLLPRVRSYAEDGRLEAAFGRFGEGPFEFRRIDGVAEGPSGRVVVVDRRRQGLTYLTEDLQPDRLVSLPGVPYNVLSMNADLLLHMEIADSEGSSRLLRRPALVHRLTGDAVAWSSYLFPFVQVERPYWGSYVRFPMAVAGDSVFVMSSLRYPVSIPERQRGYRGHDGGALRVLPTNTGLGAGCFLRSSGLHNLVRVFCQL